MKLMTFILLMIFSRQSFSMENNYKQALPSTENQKQVNVYNNSITNMSFGMDFALTLQDLYHRSNATTPLSKLTTGFTNATGNLWSNFELADGISTYIEIYLSSEHHTEVYMREGYMYVDKLPMYKNTTVTKLMENFSFKVGQMEINYGDWHLRRSDNGDASRNPLIGNTIIDANTTEVAAEVMYDITDFEVLVGFSGGTTKEDLKSDHGFAQYAKLAFDKNISATHRIRLSASYYRVDHSENAANKSKNYLYSGNRSGARYQGVMDAGTDAGQIKPATSQNLEAYIFNVLYSLGDFEFFGSYDHVLDKDPNGSAAGALPEAWKQYSLELVYQLNPEFHFATRYNVAEHEKSAGVLSKEHVIRKQIGVGYHLTKNILMKFEYVNQKYKNFAAGSTVGAGEFRGWLIEGSTHF